MDSYAPEDFFDNRFFEITSSDFLLVLSRFTLNPAQIYTLFLVRAASTNGISYHEVCGALQVIGINKMGFLLTEPKFRILFEDLVRRGFIFLREAENEWILDFPVRKFCSSGRANEVLFHYHLERGMDHGFLSMERLDYEHLKEYYGASVSNVTDMSVPWSKNSDPGKKKHTNKKAQKRFAQQVAKQSGIPYDPDAWVSA